MKGRHILVGVTGGIAAYKVAYFVRECVRAGADVRVMMTEAAAKFVAPLTFSALSKHPVAVDLWTADQSTPSDITTRHVNLANWADLVVVAPASANTIAKLAHGMADNLVTVSILASPCPILLAPAMDTDMFLNPATQKNLALLGERGMRILPPAIGELASGLHGPGRLPEVEQLVAAAEKILLGTDQDLRKKRILVTAGPTHEAIDPVRFIGNRSSGKMGFAIANAAAQRGAEVTLVAGPTWLETPRHVKRIDVVSTADMAAAVKKYGRRAQAVVMAAAVADFTPAHPSKQKIKKTGTAVPEIPLVQTADILAALGAAKEDQVLVGFALETDDEEMHAREKLRRKNLDLIVLNSLKKHRSVFGSETNLVTFIDRRGRTEALPELPKFEVANKILDRVRDLF